MTDWWLWAIQKLIFLPMSFHSWVLTGKENYTKNAIKFLAKIKTLPTFMNLQAFSKHE